jgi:hypothetical protein
MLQSSQDFPINFRTTPIRFCRQTQGRDYNRISIDLSVEQRFQTGLYSRIFNSDLT